MCNIFNFTDPEDLLFQWDAISYTATKTLSRGAGGGATAHLQPPTLDDLRTLKLHIQRSIAEKARKMEAKQVKTPQKRGGFGGSAFRTPNTASRVTPGSAVAGSSTGTPVVPRWGSNIDLTPSASSSKLKYVPPESLAQYNCAFFFP